MLLRFPLTVRFLDDALDGRRSAVGMQCRRRTVAPAIVAAALLVAGAACGAAETVHYGTSDGFAITADYYAPSRPSATAAVILPDPREGRLIWSAVADSLARAGLHVLVPDLRGTGESALQRGIRRDRARFTNGELQAARLDAEAGLRYLRELPATTIHGAALVCSGDADLASYGSRPGIMDRVVRVVISPSSTEGMGQERDKAGSVVVVVGNGDIVGIEASARLVAEDPKRECWLVEGVGRGAELLRARPDLVPQMAGWVGRMIGAP